MNSNLIIQDRPHNIRIRLVWFNSFFLLHPDVALSLSCWLSQFSWDSQQGRDRATSGRNKKNFNGPILFLYYEESLVSSNLNSKLFRFHCVVRPNLGSCYFCKRLEEIVNNLPHTNIEIGDKPSSFHLEDWWRTPWLLLSLQKVHLNKGSILVRERKKDKYYINTCFS